LAAVALLGHSDVRY